MDNPLYTNKEYEIMEERERLEEENCLMRKLLGVWPSQLEDELIEAQREGRDK